MMNCLIVDDEPLALAQLAGYISRIPFLKLIASCQDAHQASKVLASHTIDLLFVDINMPDLNGIEFVRSLPQAPMIIFTTVYSEYAIEGFRLNAVDYLMKPFDLGDCLKAAEKARKMYSMAHNTSQTQTDWDDKERTLFVKSEYKMIRINIDKIIYIESMSEYICIYLEDRNKPVITLNSLQKFSTLLPPYFMRVHRSYIVNLHQITEVSRFRILFGKDTYIPIGENYKEPFMAYIQHTGLL